MENSTNRFFSTAKRFLGKCFSCFRHSDVPRSEPDTTSLENYLISSERLQSCTQIVDESQPNNSKENSSLEPLTLPGSITGDSQGRKFTAVKQERMEWTR